MMKFLKLKLGKNDKQNNKVVINHLVDDGKKEKKSEKQEEAINDVTIQQTVKNVGEKSSLTFSKNYDVQKFNTKPLYKPLVDKKLSIILVENTAEVVKEKDTLKKIIKSLVSSGLVSVINYGTTVRQSEIFDISALDNIPFLYDNDIGDKACLYDALAQMMVLFSKKYMHIEEKEEERIRVNEVEVIGIGTCKDNCSKVFKQFGVDCFCKVLRNAKVTTKYFCLTEESFINAAEIGFHSIGAICRNY